LLAFFLSQLSCFFKLSVALFENFLVSAFKLVCRGNVADGTVQPDSVVVFYVLSYNSTGVVKRKRNTGTNAFSLYCLVKPLQLAV
jgi:hypothetical protein